MTRKKPEVYDEYSAPHGAGTVCKEPSLTRQSEAKDADINNIVARFTQTGMVPVVEAGRFADVSEVGDFRAVRDHINAVTDEFMQLDARVRARFDNDPARLIDWLADPANEAEAEKLGLVEKVVDPVVALDAAEAAVEERAERRRAAREQAARVAAVSLPPAPGGAGSGGKSPGAG